MAQAADEVILTAERIVPSEELARIPELTRISELSVAAVVELPGGARPGDCPGCYEIDEAGVRRYLEAARTPEGLRALPGVHPVSRRARRRPSGSRRGP